MRAVSPVVPGMELPEVVYAKGQAEYADLPACRSTDGTILTRWRLNFVERLHVLFGGNVYLAVMTFNRPLQPVMLCTERPDIELTKNAEDTDGDEK